MTAGGLDPAASGGAPVPDAAPGNFVDRLAPLSWRPYLRLARIDRPIGWWLLLLPCWWSAALASGVAGAGLPSPVVLALFLIGAVAMRGAGCTYNDIVDRDLDKQVERTRGRPIPSGQVTPVQAAIFLVALSLVGLAVLLTFNPFAIMLGMGSLAVVAAYPFMKRITSWPQFVLGLAFSWGGLMGWAGQFGSLEWPAVALYAGAVFWTMGYDTIYAVQDFEDDAIAGIRSTARLFGARTKLAIAILYGLASFCLAAALWGGHAGPVAWIGLAAFVTHLVRQVTKVSLADPSGALRLFRSNRDAGLLLFAGLCLDAVLRGA